MSTNVSTKMKSKKILFFSVLSLVFITNLSAQKHDYNWLYGYEYVTPDTANRNGLILNFNGAEVETQIFEKEEFLRLTSLSYSDAEGNLQLYSDGCAFYDEHGDLLENGDDIHNDFCTGNTGYSAEQGMLVLPTSDEDIISVYYNEEYISNDSFGIDVRVRLFRAMIDLKENTVLSKKEEVLDSIAGNILSATKHSNGQDWWIINQDGLTNEYKCLLISEGAVIDTVSTFIGLPVLARDASQSNFSPDGTMFARFNVVDDLSLYSFNRETGELSNFLPIDVPSALEAPRNGGLSFSGSSRFLYVNDAIGIWQYDMQASDIAGSVVQVAEREVFSTGREIFGNDVFTFFYRMALAPDCRIYITSRSGVDRLYVIMQPEQKGEACEVVQNIKIPVWNTGTTPHFPNYRLDTAPFCDSSKEFPSDLMTTVSTTSTTSVVPALIKVYPNPASDYAKVYLKNINSRAVQFVLYDLLGRQVLRRDIAVHNGEAIEDLDLGQVPPGLYVYTMYAQGEVLYSDRMVVER